MKVNLDKTNYGRPSLVDVCSADRLGQHSLFVPGPVGDVERLPRRYLLCGWHGPSVAARLFPRMTQQA